MIILRTGNQIFNYTSKGDVDLPEMYAHQDSYIQIAQLFLIAGRTRTITINTKDPAFIEAFDVLINDNDGQVTFIVDDVTEDKTVQREIKPDELYVLYDTLARIYHKIDMVRIQKEWGL